MSTPNDKLEDLCGPPLQESGVEATGEVEVEKAKTFHSFKENLEREIYDLSPASAHQRYRIELEKIQSNAHADDVQYLAYLEGKMEQTAAAAAVIQAAFGLAPTTSSTPALAHIPPMPPPPPPAHCSSWWDSPKSPPPLPFQSHMSASFQPQQQPVEEEAEIIEPHENDVLMGRRGKYNHYVGKYKIIRRSCGFPILFLHSSDAQLPFIHFFDL